MENRELFKCRAECERDVHRTFILLWDDYNVQISTKSIIKFDQCFPDVEWEFYALPSNFEDIQDILKEDDTDLHVIRETLKPFDEYTGERDWVC